MIITKSQLAQELRVTRSAVSRYCERGLPVRSDGRLDREVALRWIEANVLPTYHHGKGAQVAGRRLERPMPECLRVLGGQLTTSGHPVTESMAATLIGAVQNVPCQMAAVAVGAGAPMKVAFAVFHAAGVALARYADREMEKCGVAWSRAEHFFMPLEPDWKALAQMAGEEVNEAAWKEYAQSVFGDGSEKSADSKKPRRSRKTGAV